MLSKIYSPQDLENKYYKAWEDRGAFKPKAQSGSKPYTIMMPPPNVTGSLHMGHALTYTLQDILIRFHRMLGYDVLWQPGTDHAGIATQVVVEKQLAQEGLNRHEMGREKFLERVWQWKEQSGGTIVNQMRRLGVSADWSRQRFTMDEGLSHAVRKVFVDLYNQKLIYRDKRLVNWDPKMQTAVADIEVINTEVKGHLWYIHYPLAEDHTTFITVATTRPETMLGDTAVAVHPEDERYQHLIGKQVKLPLTNRMIPIIADDYCDQEKGSGAVKITPAHDFNDFEVGKRHKLPLINVLDHDACMTGDIPEEFQGLERFEARKKIVHMLEELGLLEKVEPNVHMVPHGERSGVVIEPWLTDQWYVNAATLAQPAIKAVEEGRTKFVPENWSATYFEWLRNIQPWCISRQLWWGHRIPVWYGPDGHYFVDMDEAGAIDQARIHYGKTVQLRQDEDVLDTWFSSALWPFSTLGWPENTADLNRYFPTQVLVTGFDIIFFWVARMMMMSLHFLKEVPFETVYMNALVRDERGQKMSKSKGNVIDPLELVNQFGADALRFTLAALAVPGRDVKFGTSQVEGYRNFATKLWNVARFCEVNECYLKADYDPQLLASPLNRWIVGELKAVAADLTTAIQTYRFNEAASTLYQFIWGTFCDWYLELIKPLFNGTDENLKQEARHTAAWVLKELLKLLHPLMPYITEELWEHLHEGKPAEMLITTPWPLYEFAIDVHAQADISWLIRLISAIRASRSELNVPASSQLPLYLQHGDSNIQTKVTAYGEIIKRLGRISEISLQALPEAKGVISLILDESTFAIPIGEVVDLAQEAARLSKEIQKIEKDMIVIANKLNNPEFIAKAREEIIEENKTRLSLAQSTHTRLSAALKQIS